jgi:hypothetical protein
VRQANPSDRRSSLLALTGDGARLADAAEVTFTERLTELTAGTLTGSTTWSNPGYLLRLNRTGRIALPQPSAALAGTVRPGSRGRSPSPSSASGHRALVASACRWAVRAERSGHPSAWRSSASRSGGCHQRGATRSAERSLDRTSLVPAGSSLDGVCGAPLIGLECFGHEVNLLARQVQVRRFASPSGCRLTHGRDLRPCFGRGEPEVAADRQGGLNVRVGVVEVDGRAEPVWPVRVWVQVVGGGQRPSPAVETAVRSLQRSPDSCVARRQPPPAW